MDKYLHIISFNVPYPPNYGGIIDVYHKIRTLHGMGIRIILHCYEYERPQAPELELICEKVYYYKRNTGLWTNLTFLPYNVNSRKDPRLLKRLLEDNYPILFEGLHSCYFLSHPALKNRMKIYRESNIEHDYYNHLARSGSGFLKGCFYRVEALRFKWYQPVIAKADISLVVSMADAAYLRKVFPDKQIEYMPSFHPNETVTSLPGKSEYILYHGKLSVEENELAALYLIRNIFCQLPYTCVIAGMNPSRKLLHAASQYANIVVEQNLPGERMDKLIREAQIHMLVTFQGTGLKLKLLNSLFAGRHIVVNDLMLTGTGLDALCHIANTETDMIRICNELMNKPFTEDDRLQRQQQLSSLYSNQKQGERLYQIISDK